MERAIALVLHDLETIQNPYAVLFKGLVHVQESSSGYQARVRGRTRTIIYYEGPAVLIKVGYGVRIDYWRAQRRVAQSNG